MNEERRPRDKPPYDDYRLWPSDAEAAQRPSAWAPRPAEQQWAELSSDEAAPAFEFEEWKLRGFTEVERDVWMDAGLRSGQAKWAAELRDSDLRPSDLQTILNGWKVIERLQRGEGVAAVVRLLREQRRSETG